jgi:hypothetical protein
VYSVASGEALRARSLLKDWAEEGFLTLEQYRRMEQDTACEFRRTNIFLRLVLFLFTLIVVGTAAALVFVLFMSRADKGTTGIVVLIFAAASYAAAESAVSRGRLYRYGIEEALAVCSVGFFCGGIGAALVSGFLVPAAGVIASLWIWHRFGLVYAFLGAMIFTAVLPGYWSSSHWAQHLILVSLYAAGLIAVAAVRPRRRFSALNGDYSIIEALLWLGIYLTINLQFSGIQELGPWFGGGGRPIADFPRVFYWATWVLTWCVPPAVLARGLRGKDRFVIAVGAIVALLTLITNKSYLGWTRHTWDPMLLGGFLIGSALFLRRWLADGPHGIRHGFTARRLSAKDKGLVTAASAVVGLASPNSIALNARAGSTGAQFGGGDFGGGGASSDF